MQHAKHPSLAPDTPPPRGARRALWREWCFFRAVIHEMGPRLAFLAVLLIAGALCFQWLEPTPRRDFTTAIYYTFSLLFAQPPEAFPESIGLRILFFLIPILGLTVIIESIVDLSLMLRDRRRSEQSWCKAMATTLKDHIVVVGLGKLGFRTWTTLRKLGFESVVIESEPQNQFLDEVRKDGSAFLLGDARREQLLEDAGVAQARAIIIATNNDLANLEIAMDARRINPRIRVVLRMFDQALADKVAGAFDIKIAMSQSGLSAPAFATAAVGERVVSSAVVSNTLIVMERWTIHPSGSFSGRSIADILAAHSLSVVELTRAGNARLFPPPDTTLAPRDEILVQAPYSTLTSLRAQATGA